MKKIVLIIAIILCVFTIDNTYAKTIKSTDVAPSTYIIGKSMFTRNASSATGYDGKLTTERIMLGSKTILSNSINDMTIYYKTVSGKWIDALTGEDLTNKVPTTFEIDVTDLAGSGTTVNPNLETYNIPSNNINPSTYVIGNYVFTRNKFANENHINDGALTTKEIMLAAKSISGNNENDMKISYKTATGAWINALTGERITPPTNYEVAVIDLINQKDERMTVNLINGTQFNQKIKSLAGNSQITKILRANSISQSNMIEDNLISTNNSEVPVYAWFDNGIIYYYPVHYLNNVKIYLASQSNGMFANLPNLVEVNLNGLDTSKVTNMRNMFANCSGLTNLNLSTFNTSNVTTFEGMFDGCVNLVTLNISSFNTSKAGNMSKMFRYNTRLTNLDVSHFDTKEVYDMSYMFNDCDSLETLNLSNFNTSKVTNMREMFENCDNLKTLNVSSFDTSKVTDTVWMFFGCTSLSTLDLHNFDLSSVTSGTYMIVALNSLKIFVTPKAYPTEALDIDRVYYDGSSNVYSQSTLEGIPTETTLYSATKLLKGEDFANKIRVIAGDQDPNTLSENESITKIIRETNVDNVPTSVIGNSNYIISTNDAYVPVYAWVSNGILYYFSASDVIYLNQDSSSMFNNLLNVTEIDFTGIDTSNVTNMNAMFYGCESLTSIDLSGFDTSKVGDMAVMFADCVNLVTLNLSNFNTANVHAMYSMFANCIRLKNLNISNFNTSKVDNMYQMFYGCESLTSIDLSHFNTVSLTEISEMFYGCTHLETLNISSFDMSNISSSNVKDLLYNATALREIVAPKVYGTNTINLPKTMYFEGNRNGVNSLNSSVPSSTTLKSTLWGTIDPIDSTITVSNSNMELRQGGENGEREYNYDGDGIVSCNSSDATKATCSVDRENKKIVVTPVAVTTENVTITVSATATAYFNAPTNATFTVSVGEPVI